MNSTNQKKKKKMLEISRLLTHENQSKRNAYFPKSKQVVYFYKHKFIMLKKKLWNLYVKCEIRKNYFIDIVY